MISRLGAALIAFLRAEFPLSNSAIRPLRELDIFQRGPKIETVTYLKRDDRASKITGLRLEPREPGTFAQLKRGKQNAR
jgi:hypothetical protein